MRRAAALSLLAIVSIGLVLAACSSDDGDDAGGDTTPSSQPTADATSAEGEPTEAATSDDGSSSISGNIDVELTGGLEATWQQGDDGVAANCSIFSDQLSATIKGLVDGTSYGLIVAQQTYSPGAYFLPEGGIDPARNPSAQITTSSDSSKQWDLATGQGNGSISVAGGTSEAPLFITIDGDLADKNGGDPVHVTADVTCDVTS